MNYLKKKLNKIKKINMIKKLHFVTQDYSLNDPHRIYIYMHTVWARLYEQ